MEKHHVPTVFLATSQFARNARLSSEDNGVPKLRIVTVPAEKYYSERISKDRAKPVAASVLNSVIDQLTRPLTPQESILERKSKPQPNITVSGDTVEALIENFNQLFLKNQWSDGLPLIPPTPAAVRWMLKGTSRSASEVIGSVPPRNGTATIQNIAINAVMAGAAPEHLPVIIAAVEGITDERFDSLHFLTSSGSFNLVITVSGPIVKEIGMNSGVGYLGIGSRANSAIGRAVRMCMTNQGHLWPGENDMALTGRAAAHTFVVVAENLEDSPWEPYHVSQGYKAADSCVTVAVVGGYIPGPTQPRVYGGGAVAMVSAESIVKQLLAELGGSRQPITGNRSSFGSSHQRHLFLLPPETAQEMHSLLGYSRASLQQYLYDKSSVAYEDLHPAEIASVRGAINSGSIPKDLLPVFEAGLKPGGKVPVVLRPEDIHIIVAGGYPGYTLAMSGYLHGPFKPLTHNTKLIRGATHTSAGATPVMVGTAPAK